MGTCLWDWKGFKLGVLQFRVGAGPRGHWEGGWMANLMLDDDAFLASMETQVPWVQVSRSLSLLLMVKPLVFLVVVGMGRVHCLTNDV
ncbi:sodium/metabolite cotransporter BASS4 [Pyrus ussuriensis x Pyrus communis]|uniref:Sodium/metabolite cotransporter BASS4 n=1 Tax=Pyrus ussuriensis x Pyrus communis TaxID=2448454 RepID=A0A5N5FZC6_9ROSA|nr:sodium/metabolite cotransporter BASS4 [Pyrus ussuriensis x Pyrus communis]